MDSLVRLSHCQNASMLQLLTEPMAVEPRSFSHPPHAHYRVDGPTVEAALQAALHEDVPPTLADIAARLGYLTAASLQFRCRGLCQAIIRKRRANLKLPSTPAVVPIPRARVEQALSNALAQDEPISLSSLANSIGLRNKRRLYKGFHDLRNAVVANNRRHRAQRGTAIGIALRAALAEAPAPTLKAVAKRLGFKSTSALTRRFPDLCAELKRHRQRALDNGLHRSLESAIREPSVGRVEAEAFVILADVSNSPM